MSLPSPKTFPTGKPLPLATRRSDLLLRIQIAREETAAAGRRVGVDLQVTERTRRSILTSFKVLKASLVAAGVIWSFNASSRIARGSRLITFAISMLSTARTLRKVGAFFVPIANRSSGSPGSSGSPIPSSYALSTTPSPLT